MFHYQNFYAPDGSRVNGAALPTPVTTKEQYMYAMATGGSTEGLPTPVSSEEQYMKYLMDNGASLPVPAVEDAGKAVVVDENGGYALGSGSGGGALAVVATMTSLTTATLDVSVNDIKAAITANRVVVLRIPARNMTAYISAVDGDGNILFQSVDVASTMLYVFEVESVDDPDTQKGVAAIHGYTLST